MGADKKKKRKREKKRQRREVDKALDKGGHHAEEAKQGKDKSPSTA